VPCRRSACSLGKWKQSSRPLEWPPPERLVEGLAWGLLQPGAEVISGPPLAGFECKGSTEGRERGTMTDGGLSSKHAGLPPRRWGPFFVGVEGYTDLRVPYTARRCSREAGVEVQGGGFLRMSAHQAWLVAYIHDPPSFIQPRSAAMQCWAFCGSRWAICASRAPPSG